METFDESKAVKATWSDSDSFFVRYEYYLSKIYAYCYYKLPHKETAQVISSEVFSRALNAFVNGKYIYDRDSKFSSWLYRIAHKLVVDYYKSNRQFQRIEISENTPDEDNFVETLQKEIDGSIQSQMIKKILLRFDDQTQTIFVLKFNQDMNFEEISEVLNINLSTVKNEVLSSN